jgi:PAS domain S-box-containing protein
MPRRVAHLITLLVGLALAAALLAALYADQQRHAQKARLAVFHTVSTVQSGFENALNSRLHLLRTLRTFLALNPDLDQPTFAALVGGLLADTGGIRFVELARGEEITHVYPESGASAVLGRSLTIEYPPDIRAAVLKASATRRIQLLPPGEVLEGGEAVVAVSPVFLGEGAGSWGSILVLIDAGTLFREAGLIDASSRLDLALREEPTATSGGRMVFGRREVFGMTPVVMNTPVPGGLWQMAAVPLEGWTTSPHRLPILTVGLLLVAAISGCLWGVMTLVLGRLREREKYRSLVQNVRSVILRVDMDGSISFCNEYAENFFGYAPGELIGRPLVGTLIPERGPEGEVMKRQLLKVLRAPLSHPRAETMAVRKNGDMVWVSWSNAPVSAPDGRMVELLCVGTDITERKRMEEALRQSERQYRLLAENVRDVIWGTDADLHLTFVSRSESEMRGYAPTDVLGRHVSEFLSGPSRGRLAEAVDILKAMPRVAGQAPSSIHDLEFLRADGSTIWLETRLGLLLNEGGDIVGILGVGRDITDRKLAEALREDVERMARHDLKTPLGAVVGLPGEIRRLGRLSEAQLGMLHTIEEAGETMLGLINRSLDLFKMERGTYSLDRSDVDVLQLFERIKTELRCILREKGISVGIEVKGDLPDAGVVVPAEEELFRSMAANLLLNALQASPEGGSVTVTLELADSLTMVFNNRGEVPSDIRETFFEKYTRSESSSGTGLGTYSARLVARTHGGDIALDATVQGETSVIVTMPRQ